MLKRISLLLLLILSFSICSVFAENWYYVGRSADHESTIFIDNDNVKKDRDFASIWVKMVHADGSYAIGQTLYSRYKKLSATIYLVQYSANGNVIWSGRLPGTPDPIIPGSIDEAIFNLIW